MTIMQRIEELCAERGWTLYELSNSTSISVCTLYSCKKKNHEPTNETLKKICAAFGITVFQFYHDLYEIPDLTEEQRKVLSTWALLEDNEKNSFKTIADIYISNRTIK